MSLVYRGISGSQYVYWLEGASVPAGITSYTLVGEANTISSSQVVAPVTQSISIFTNSWSTVYSVDFTALATGSVYSNGLININGVNWDRINSANATYMSYSGAGRGLEQKLALLTSDYWGAVRTLPAFVLPLNNIPGFSNFSMNDYDCRVVFQFSCSAINSSEQVIAALEHSGSLTASNINHIESFVTNTGNGYTFGSARTQANSGLSKNVGWTTGVDLENVVSLQFDQFFSIDFSVSSSILTPSAFIDPTYGNFIHRGRQAWAAWNIDAGAVPLNNIPRYSDYNFVFGAKAWAGGGDGIVNLFRVYVQVRPKNVSAATTGSYRISRIHAAGYTTTNATAAAPAEIGGFYFDPTEHNNANAVIRSILATNAAPNIAYIKLWNSTTGAYVDIGGPGTSTLSTAATAATKVESVNLYTANNFNSASPATYILHLYGTGSVPLSQHYSTELITR